ncbi:MAG: hypothetical protein HQK91_00500 [Nitrospirae bacterium]|nr:hypothetical protein [Nitrospirota bacterium]MBF0539916.1 hypothetical protein [Nitrospirota bacterium]
MKKFITVLLIALFVMSLTGVAMSADKMKGKITSMMITLEEGGKKEVFECGKGCDVKTKIDAEGKTDVTVEYKDAGGKKEATVIRRAVAGC